MMKSKNIRRRLLAGVLSVVLLCGMLCSVSFLPTIAADEQGMTFNATDIHKVKKFAAFPDTVEAWIYFPADTASTTRGGVILGNYQANESCINYEIAVGGYPKVWYETQAKDAADSAYLCEVVEFKDVYVYTGEWLHLAIVRDVENKELRCYINGEWKQTATVTTNTNAALTLAEVPYTYDLALGADLRGSNTPYFKGQMKSVTVYEDVRTDAEIVADMTVIGTDSLLANWNLVGLAADGYIPDLSGNGYHAMTDAYAASIKGKTFNATDIHQLQESLTTYPSTYEAWVKFPADAGSLRGGAILGNYMGNNNAAISFEINSYGKPRVYYETQGYTEHASLQFDNVCVYTGDWVHLAIVRDVANNQMICYINGEVAQTLTDTMMPEVSYTNKLVLGGDLRSGNAQYFKGELKSVAVYADARTADEIKRDMNAANGDDLIASWDLLNLDTEGYIPDISGNGYHAMTAAYAASIAGKTFNATDIHRLQKSLAAYPNTCEAWVKFPEDAGTLRGGVILGNYQTNESCINYEIAVGGHPKVWYETQPQDAADGAYLCEAVEFTDVCVYTGEWVHLAIVRDVENKEMRCYVNGELKQTATVTSGGAALTLSEVPYKYNLALGADLRSGNVQYFKGELKSVAVYADVRTADEIAVDMNAANGDDLLASWNLMNLDIDGYIPDVSGNGYHAMTAAYATVSEGMTFVAGEYYQAQKVLPSQIGGFEAQLYFPTTISGRGGVILGNYGSAGDCVNFEIYTGGHPRIYYDDGGTTGGYIFSEVNVYTGKIVDLKIVFNTANSTCDCYVNGEVKQSIALTSTPTLEMTDAVVLGGDLRSGNEQWFKGTLLSAKVYDLTGDAIASYALSGKSNATSIADDTGNGYTMELHRTWFSDKEEVTDYAFSMVAVGDTQIVTEKHPDKLHYIYDWIVDNKESKNIQYVMGLGDITNANTDTEWNVAYTQISRMNGVVPYSLVRGNHDSIAQYNKYLNVSPYNTTYSGSYGEGVLNTWRTLTVGDIHYLIMGLDYGAADDVLAWAGEVIEAHPHHNVIITTHAYLFRDGTTLDEGDVCPPTTDNAYNNGDHMWDKLIKKHENIVLVLSGHDPSDNVVMTQTEGENGNVVTQMLIDPQGVDAAQGATGMVAVLYFSADGKNVTVEQYSTVKKQYYMEESQFEMELNVIEWPGEATIDGEGLVTVTPGNGYELKAGSLIVTDANGGKFVPERVGFREGGDASTYVVNDVNFNPVGATVQYEFVKATLDNPNIGNVGNSINEEVDGLRFVSRFTREKDEATGMEYLVITDGEKYAITDYGMLLSSAPGLAAGNGTADMVADTINPYVQKISHATLKKYYDVCDDHVDIAVSIINIDKLTGNGYTSEEAYGMEFYARPYVVVTVDDADRVLYGDVFSCAYEDVCEATVE